MVVAGAFGCAGENQNYRINDQGVDRFREGYPTEPGAPVGDATPSIQGADRSHWEKITVSAVSGSVTHQPHYFDGRGGGATWHLSEVRTSPLRADASAEAQAEAALSLDLFRGSAPISRSFGSYLTNLCDIATLPCQAVGEPPWSASQTP